MELYYVITVIDREKTKQMLDIHDEIGLKLVLTNMAKGTATEEQLKHYDLESREKAVVSTFAGREEAEQLMKAAKKKMYIDIPGNGIMLSVPLKSVGGGKALEYLTNADIPTEGMPEMKFDNELIIVILNEGYSDAVMDAARSAGAGGGTVLHAKGTGSNMRKFLGVSIAEEKDMIYILSPSLKKSAIMDAINKRTGRDTDAGAICFSLPVSEVAGLRQFEE